MQANIKIKNSKHLKIKVLVNLGYTHIGINKQLVRDKKIQIKPINFLFKVFDIDRTKNGEVTRVAPLEVKINGHKEQLEAVVTDLNSMDMFLGYDWLVRHNPEVNWKDGKIQFMRCLESCRMKYQDIEFKTKRTQATENTNKNNGEIEKKLDATNPEDLPDYI